MTILRQHFRSEWTSLLGWSVVVAVIVFWVVTLFPAMGAQEGYQQLLASLPPALKAMLGDLSRLGALEGWLQIEVFSWVPLVMVYYVVAGASGIVARDLDRKTGEFLFALPVPRWRIVLTRAAVVAANLAVVHAVIYGAIWAGAAYIGEPMRFGPYFRVVAISYALLLSVGSFALFLSTFVSDYSRALLLGMGSTFTLYFLDLGLKTANKGEAFRRWTFFGRYRLDAALGAGSFPWGDVAVLAIYAAAFLGLSLVCFEKREIGT